MSYSFQDFKQDCLVLVHTLIDTPQSKDSPFHLVNCELVTVDEDDPKFDVMITDKLT
jgi:hypothetical protein